MKGFWGDPGSVGFSEKPSKIVQLVAARGTGVTREATESRMF